MWAELASSVLGGGVTGLVGAVITKIADYKTKKLEIEASKEKYAHEVKMKHADAQILQQEWAARTRVAEIEGDSREAVADAQAFAASFNEPQRYADHTRANSAQMWLLVILDFVRGAVRPGLTLYLCVLTTVIYFQARDLIGTGLPLDQGYKLVQDIVNTVLYLTVSCLMWWFGARQKEKPPKIGR